MIEPMPKSLLLIVAWQEARVRRKTTQTYSFNYAKNAHLYTQQIVEWIKAHALPLHEQRGLTLQSGMPRSADLAVIRGYTALGNPGRLPFEPVQPL